MKEALFVKINKKVWVEIENSLNKGAPPPDRLTHYFVRLTDDLSFTKTNFPNSNTHVFLNELASRVYQLIYKNKRESTNRLVRFWKYEFPGVMYECRRELLYSFLIFGISVLIGVFSSAVDENFVRLILGDGYINMTLVNIENEDPMAVYKDAHRMNMFLGITLNNVLVSFRVFAYGLLFSIGAGYILMRNGIMLGSFQYFFHTKGLLFTSALTIWIHGAIEISSIVIAGAAGLVIGNSFMFPGTYTRKESFKRGAKKGVKIVVGLVPLFIAAGFLEAYVTRLTELPDVIKLAIILSTFSGVVYYCVLYPLRLVKNGVIIPTEN